jgi:transcription initiation factor TFIID subunit 10
LDSYSPTIPEALSNHYLERSGVECKDERILKLVSLAADKVLTEILYEAKQVSKLRQQAVKNNPKKRQEMNETLELEDVAGSLTQMRIYFRRKRPRNE